MEANIGSVAQTWPINRAERGKSAMRVVDGSISDLGGRQHGVVTRQQLLDIGLSSDAIDRRLGGSLHRIHGAVYAVGHPKITRQGRYMAAVLACGRDAVLSHRSAGAHWASRATPA
jgi:hypothetical protein